ncbi:MAG: hypothetical protein FWE88_01060 [Phycisphaerae bacterium]|nr:hypothetical protein [Phycisphaerae bacterium]
MTDLYEKYPAMKGSRRAIIRAARRAAEIARQHGQPLILWRDGQIVRVMPDDLPPLPDEAPDLRDLEGQDKT